MDEKLSAALEDYLVEIWKIARQGREVRVTDIAEIKQISKASVNKAVRQLKEHGMVEQEHYGSIYLTEEGAARAKSISDNYEAWYRFMTEVLELDKAEAAEQADVMEHILSRSGRKKLKKFVKKQKRK